MSRWIFLFLSTLSGAFKTHFAGNNIATQRFIWEVETRQEAEVSERMAACRICSTDHPVFAYARLSFSTLHSQLSKSAVFTPDASWSKDRICVTLTAATAAAVRDHCTINS